MRLEVSCKNLFGLTRELLDVLLRHNVDLRGVEITKCNCIYLYFSTLDFQNFSHLMAEIRRILSVIDVRTVIYTPYEYKHLLLHHLLRVISEPVLSIDLKNKIKIANPAAQNLFNITKHTMCKYNINNLINGFNCSRMLENEKIEFQSKHVIIDNKKFFMEVFPMYLYSQNRKTQQVGTTIILKSPILKGFKVKNLNVTDNSKFDHIISVNPKMLQVISQAKKLSMHDAPLLIIGETGTGKDMLARACHFRSSRGIKPFLALNCAALPDDVAETELYGYSAGAYPHLLKNKKGFFEQANGGTVLLDEVGEMSHRMQAKLLRFLNDGTFRKIGQENEIYVDVRVICATQKNLLELVRKGKFRKDLFYRLNVLTLSLPPLRERLQDILPLTKMFVQKFANEQKIPCPYISTNINSFLTNYNWPGNIRQLKNVLYRALTQLENDELCAQDIILTEPAIEEEIMEGTLDEMTTRFERSVLTKLYVSYPSTRKLAKRLGVSHTAIANKLREHGLGNRKK